MLQLLSTIFWFLSNKKNLYFKIFLKKIIFLFTKISSHPSSFTVLNSKKFLNGLFLCDFKKKNHKNIIWNLYLNIQIVEWNINGFTLIILSFWKLNLVCLDFITLNESNSTKNGFSSWIFLFSNLNIFFLFFKKITKKKKK